MAIYVLSHCHNLREFKVYQPCLSCPLPDFIPTPVLTSTVGLPQLRYFFWDERDIWCPATNFIHDIYLPALCHLDWSWWRFNFYSSGNWEPWRRFFDHIEDLEELKLSSWGGNDGIVENLPALFSGQLLRIMKLEISDFHELQICLGYLVCNDDHIFPHLECLEISSIRVPFDDTCSTLDAIIRMLQSRRPPAVQVPYIPLCHFQFWNMGFRLTREGTFAGEIGPIEPESFQTQRRELHQLKMDGLDLSGNFIDAVLEWTEEAIGEINALIELIQ
jgi:hypothetical protein